MTRKLFFFTDSKIELGSAITTQKGLEKIAQLISERNQKCFRSFKYRSSVKKGFAFGASTAALLFTKATVHNLVFCKLLQFGSIDNKYF